MAHLQRLTCNELCIILEVLSLVFSAEFECRVRRCLPNHRDASRRSQMLRISIDLPIACIVSMKMKLSTPQNVLLLLLRARPLG